MINVINNFLNNDEFFEIQKLLSSKKFPYFLTENYKVLTHPIIYKTEYSLFLESLISKLSEQLKVKTILSSETYLIIKDKENLSLNIGKKDPYDISLNDNSLTSLLYINSNNGYTQILGKDKIDPVQNRLLTFSSNISYEETTPTNEPFKSVIKLTYYL
jgi:hypothetical protein